MSLNNIQLTPQQLVQLYGQVLVETPGRAGAAMPVRPEPAMAEVPDVPPAPPAVAPPVQEAPAEPAPEAPLIRSLGGNARRVLVLVQKEKEAFLPQGDLTFLTTILGACGLSIADIALVNRTGVTDKNYSELTAHFNSQKVLLFDITPGQLGMPINFPPFQVQAFKECQYLQAPALHLIEADVTLKKSLWAALKNMFQL